MKPWVRIDTDFLRHPKVVGLSDRHKLVYLESIFLAYDQNLDGQIVKGAVPGSAAARRMFVDTGLWRELSDGGIEVVGYLDRQESRAERDARTTKAREAAQARWGHAQRNAPSIAPSTASGNAQRNAPDQDQDQDQDVDGSDVFQEKSVVDLAGIESGTAILVERLLNEIRDRNELTDRFILAIAQHAPEAAFIHAIDALHRRRQKAGPPLVSESKYAHTTLANYLEENRSPAAVAGRDDDIPF